MPRIMKYRKSTNKYTTYIVIDNGDEEKRVTELCTIGKYTYISVPDNLILPEQPEQITLEPVTITEELKGQIEEKSPHIQLIKKRVRKKITKKYSIEDTLKIIRNKINGLQEYPAAPGYDEYAEYNSYVESCIEEGKLRKEELVKLENPIEPIK